VTLSPSASVSGPLPGSASLQIYLNGRLVPKEQAVVSVFDHGLLYGDGVFEGIRAYNGRVFRLKEHLERLFRSARAILLEVGLTLPETQEAVLQTLRANKLKDAYVRLVVTRGVGDLGLDPKNAPGRRCSSSPTRSPFTPRNATPTGSR
jgi:branched-chain amino acid aminotransferase